MEKSAVGFCGTGETGVEANNHLPRDVSPVAADCYVHAAHPARPVMGVGMFSTVLGLINQAPTCIARTETPNAQKTGGCAMTEP